MRLLVLVWSLSTASAFAVERPERSIAAVRIETPLVIDGKLDEPAWAGAPPAGDFIQRIPREAEPATEKTEFRIVYDDENIYVGVTCFDSHPELIVSRLTRRDRDIEADWVGVTIDSRHSHDSALYFQVSAAGVLVDGQFTNDNKFSFEWDGIWKGQSDVNGRGWTAELAIPLTQLRFSTAEDQVWGLQVHRGVSRKREKSMWAFIPDSSNNWVSRAGHLTGIHGLKPRRTFELRPYGVARARGTTREGWSFLGAQSDGRRNVNFDIGADLKLGLTSRLTLDATVNPDFGQVEADQIVLNLTRFETFFPEKRPFFLEGRDVFETPYTQFYPRRIGRQLSNLTLGDSHFGPGGEREVIGVPGSVRILGAAKVSGAVSDRASIAALGAVTANEALTIAGAEGGEENPRVESGRSWAVVRGRYQVGDSSFLGLMATGMTRLGSTHYLAAADHDAYTQGIDGTWLSGDGRFRLQAQVLLSERIGGSTHEDFDTGRPCTDPDTNFNCVPISRPDGTRMSPGDVGVGGGTRFDYKGGDRWDWGGNVQVFSPRLFLNDLGFLQEFNQANFELFAVRKELKAGNGLQRFYLIPWTAGAISLDGKPLNSWVGFNTEWNHENHWFSSHELAFRLPGIWDNVETFDGAYFEKPAQLEASFRFRSNQADRLWWMWNTTGQLEVGAPGYSLNMTGGLYFQVASNVELGLEPQVGWELQRVRFYDCATDSGRNCLVENGARHYRFARLDANFISLTMRATYTFSNKLSLSAYGQLFTDRGHYHRFYAIDGMGSHPLLRREDLRPTDDDGDDDGDGVPDNDFEDAQLNLNLVGRWEPTPGTTLFLVYTRGMNSDFYRLRNLGRGPAEDMFLIKFVYFLA